MTLYIHMNYIQFRVPVFIYDYIKGEFVVSKEKRIRKFYAAKLKQQHHVEYTSILSTEICWGRYTPAQHEKTKFELGIKDMTNPPRFFFFFLDGGEWPNDRHNDPKGKEA